MNTFPAGFSEFSSSKVRKACEKTLASIRIGRDEAHNENFSTFKVVLERYYSFMLRINWLLPKKYRVNKPTMGEIWNFYKAHDGGITYKRIEEWTYAEQEELCKSLIRLIDNSESASIYLSEKAARSLHF